LKGAGEFFLAPIFYEVGMKHIIVAIVAVALSAFSIPNEYEVKDSCDYVEINHVYRLDEGEPKLRMIQYIWWEWRNKVLLPILDPATKQRTGNWKQGSDFIVREYLVVYSGSSRPNEVASVSLSKKNDKWICIFYDKEDRIVRTVVCNWLTKTHTLYDVEIENRDIIRVEDRNNFHKR